MPDIGIALELGDVIDVSRIQEMMDSFYKLAHIAMAIVDLKGKVLVGVGWQDVCTKFHRVNPVSCKHCLESDTQLAKDIPKGHFKLYKCKNNMWDMASPIYVGDMHMGHIFIGQFFFEDEHLDYELFRRQAQTYCFGEEEYIAAIGKVPRINRDTLDAAKQFFIDFAHNISQLSYTNIKLANVLEEQRKAQETLRVNEAKLRTIMDATKESIWLLAPDGVAIMGNQTAIERFGNQDVIGRYLGDFTPPEVHKVRMSYFKKAVESGKVVEFEDLIDDVVYKVSLYPVKDAHDRVTAVAAYACDITESKKAELELRQSRDELEKRVVERTAALAETVKKLEEEIHLRTYAQEKVRAERKRFEDVLDMLPVHAVLLTPDCHIVYANNFFEERFGKHNGKKCYELIFGRTELCENCQTFNVLKTNKPVFWEWTSPDGSSYDIYDYPFKDSDGSPLIMEIGLDVSAHKQALKSLKSSSLYIRGLLEANADPMFIVDLNGKVTDVNKSAENATGIGRDELIGSDFSQHFTEPKKAKQGCELVMSEGQVQDYPLDIRLKSGEIMRMLCNATLYKDEAGNVQGVFASARDITKRKAAEDMQNFTNAMLELFAKKSTRKEYLDSTIEMLRQWSGCEFAGIRLNDGNGNIPYESYVWFDKDFIKLGNLLHAHKDNCVCTRAITKKLTDHEKKYRTAGDSFFCNDTEAFLESLSAEERKQYRGTCIKWGFRSLAVIPIHYRKEVLGVIRIADLKKDMVPLSKIEFVEITISVMLGEAVHRFNAEAELDEYRRHLEEKVELRTQELARSNKELEQFAYVASHDLQEPLRAVAGFMELLKSRLADSLEEESLKYMNFAVGGAHRMQSLIQGLLEYSRVGSHSKAPAMIDAERPLKYAMEHLKIAIDESGAKITAGDLPTVKIDEVQFMQLFQNLIGNAIKFKSDKNPHVHITAEKNDGFWQFSVRDNGIGIEQEYSERIFLIFQRLHTREKYPGTGIGLSICKKIVERHGGKIWVESQPGQGSTFYFTVPEIGVS
ncbi:MAG: PocR ligand-binding domain-containing protein [Planctomycetaceae bacterium]|nr:PocR ligand-binding domain-containing protein [Planctomycetaceae bacterium]